MANVLSTPCFSEGGEEMGSRDSPTGKHPSFQIKDGSRSRKGLVLLWGVPQNAHSTSIIIDIPVNGLLIQLQTMMSTLSHRISNGKCFIDTCFTEGMGFEKTLPLESIHHS
ncbi:hypothetical protein CEXT_103581 [Caerostris extrusa]|uniref:Uncharacterized protein n=1 Tax=Caerostris extrusa TaxID=172846 RepID=A0AAV4PP57_CAEEX|nr:hypothetical protein CEXT_103581 [Caerostris extrusa]